MTIWNEILELNPCSEARIFVRHFLDADVSDADIFASAPLAWQKWLPENIQMQLAGGTPNQEVLVWVVKNDTDWRVRYGAATQLNNQEVLAWVMKNDPDWWVRRAAAGQLNNQEVLAWVVKNDTDWWVRRAAAWRLNNQKVLAWVVKNDTDADVRRAAAEQLHELI